MEKFKYGPIIYNCVDEEDDSGNYYWAGEPPVAYDQWGVPVDRHGKQTLPLDCPFTKPSTVISMPGAIFLSVKNFRMCWSFTLQVTI